AQLTQRVGHQLTVSTNARQGRTAARPSPSRGPLTCEMPARLVLARPVPPREAMASSLLTRPILERHQSGREHRHPGTDERSWWPRPAASSPWRTSSRRRDEARPLGEAPARDHHPPVAETRRETRQCPRPAASRRPPPTGQG